MAERESSSDRITVMHLIGSLRIGGAERQMVNLSPLIDPARFRTIIVTLQPGGALENELRGTHVELRTLSFRMRSAILAILRLVSWLKTERVDIIHTHMYAASLYGRIAGLLAHVPAMVTTDHGKGLWKRWYHIAWERFAVRFTAARIAVSEDIYHILLDREKTPASLIALI